MAMLDLYDLIRSLPDQGLAATDLSGVISVWTPGAAALTGWSEADAIGRPLSWLDAPEPGRSDQSLALLADAPISGWGWRRCHNGDSLWCEFTRFAVRDLAGGIVGYADAFRVPSDLSATGQPSAKQAQDWFALSTRRFADVERVAHMGSWEYDILADQMTWSAGACELLRRDREELPSRLVTEPQHIHPDDRVVCAEDLVRAIATGAPFERECRMIRGDGRVRRVHARGEAVAGADGHPRKLIGTLFDVTDGQNASRAVNEVAAELSRRAQEIVQVLRDGDGDGDGPDGDVEPVLSRRQHEILELVAQGLNNAAIADRLFLTENTVKWHMGKILRTLGVANRAQATAIHMNRKRTPSR